MAYKLITESDPLEMKGIVVVLYGEPGIGKTSLAFTAEKPLLEDYDDGVKRSVGRKTSLRIDNWEDAAQFHISKDFETLSPKTLIIDTAGSLLDNYMASYVIRQDIKNARLGGELSLQGYGALKNVFKQFVNLVKGKGVDIIFVCHSETIKEGDNIKYIPGMTGGSYDILIAEADMVGYMESRNNKRTIRFDPTDRTIGKNTAELPMIEIPHYNDPGYQNFMQNIISKTKQKMFEFSEKHKEAMKFVSEFKAKIQEAKEFDSLVAFLPDIEKEINVGMKIQLQKIVVDKGMDFLQEGLDLITRTEEADEMRAISDTLPEIFREPYKRALWAKAKELGFDFDKQTNMFVKTESVQADNELVAADNQVIKGAGKTLKGRKNATKN